MRIDNKIRLPSAPSWVSTKIDDFELGGDDAGHQGADEEEPAEENQQPAASSSAPGKKWTKSQLYNAYKGRGPHRMTCDFLHEPGLREHLVILVEFGKPLAQKYAADLRAQKGRTERLFWASRREAFGSALETGAQVLMVAFSPYFHKRRRLTPACPGMALNCDDERIADEVALMRLAATFAGNLASNWIWSQQMFSLTLPFAAASLLSGSYLGDKPSTKEMVSLKVPQKAPGCVQK